MIPYNSVYRVLWKFAVSDNMIESCNMWITWKTVPGIQREEPHLPVYTIYSIPTYYKHPTYPGTSLPTQTNGYPAII